MVQDNLRRGDMVNTNRIRALIEERETLHPDDPRIEECWKMLTKELVTEEEATIKFISNCDEHDIYWLSEIFEDISAVLQSQEFVQTLRDVQTKYPKLDLQADIMYAEMVLNNI